MEPIFDHEKLDVYGLELQFVSWTTDFLEEVSQSPVSSLSWQRATGSNRSNVDSFSRAFRSRRIPGSRRWNQRMNDFEHEQEHEHEEHCLFHNSLQLGKASCLFLPFRRLKQARDNVQTPDAVPKSVHGLRYTISVCTYTHTGYMYTRWNRGFL
jgi:hypothetical protein